MEEGLKRFSRQKLEGQKGDKGSAIIKAMLKAQTAMQQAGLSDPPRVKGAKEKAGLSMQDALNHSVTSPTA